ncbi:hypothetical protein N9X13_03840 [Alphaproteobacteria bacterium]|nr:hypothetical protein [Alphaproteobacteria bacterium]
MKIYPPLMVLFGILAQLLIGYVAPVRPILNETWQYIGVGLMLFGFTLIFLVARSFRTNETTIIPDGRPSTLMENGLFAYSRNPIYLSMTIFLLGSALAVGQILCQLLCCSCGKFGLLKKRKAWKLNLGKFIATIKCGCGAGYNRGAGAGSGGTIFYSLTVHIAALNLPHALFSDSFDVSHRVCRQ